MMCSARKRWAATAQVAWKAVKQDFFEHWDGKRSFAAIKGFALFPADLNAGADALAVADVALQPPAAGIDVVQADNRLDKGVVEKARLRNPLGARHVHPLRRALRGVGLERGGGLW